MLSFCERNTLCWRTLKISRYDVQYVVINLSRSLLQRAHYGTLKTANFLQWRNQNTPIRLRKHIFILTGKLELFATQDVSLKQFFSKNVVSYIIPGITVESSLFNVWFGTNTPIWDKKKEKRPYLGLPKNAITDTRERFSWFWKP